MIVPTLWGKKVRWQIGGRLASRKRLRLCAEKEHIGEKGS
jgi:hypothetical protein